MSQKMLEVTNLSKDFGPVKAIKDLSFSVKKGEIFGFLGPNGAGKTTTMRILTNFLPASGGSFVIDGLDSKKDDLKIRRKIGYLPETTPLYGDMFVDEYITYAGKIRGIPKKDLSKAVEKMLQVCGLTHMRKRYVGKLSKGYRQRVGLAQAMLHEPDLLILDEPMSGLDPNQIIEIRELIKEIGKTKTVIYCSHILSEVAATCDRILIIKDGKKVIQGTPDELNQSCDTEKEYVLTVKAPADELTQALKSLTFEYSATTSHDGDLTTLSLVSSTDKSVTEALFAIVKEKGWTLNELYRKRLSLEEVFTRLTKEA